jgi:Mlc titration factor MtfA (ptsG expression regulator)
MFSWFTEHRRRRLLDEPFPEPWLDYLRRDMPHYEFLSPDEQQLLRDYVQIFVAEKNWEFLGGLKESDEIRVAHCRAGLPAAAGPRRQPQLLQKCRVRSGVPDRLQGKGEQAISSGINSGIVPVGPSYRLGEAWGQGPVVLSWSDALQGGRNPLDGRNVVLHEFAHKLDMLGGGDADGVPRLPGGQEQYDEWHEVMSAEYDQLVAQHEHGRATLLDDYGATSPAEFFAVATECFFEKPCQMRDKHERLYDVLKGYFRQDTAARVEAATAAETTAPASEGDHAEKQRPVDHEQQPPQHRPGPSWHDGRERCSGPASRTLRSGHGDAG